MSRSHGVLAPTACSVLSLDAGEPLAGTAPEVLVWIAIEQPGPWGAKALLDSHLPAGVGSDLLERLDAWPITPLLVRRPGTHADPRTTSPSEHRRTVLIAYTGGVFGEDPWLVSTTTVGDDSLIELLATLDPARLVDGERPEGAWHEAPQRWALICTNGRRDTCCAVSGRLLLDEVLEATSGERLDTGPDDVLWECSHVGGHRFAPTALVLPEGYVLGRATTHDVITSLDGHLPLDALRGRSALAPIDQAAEIAELRHRAELATGATNDDPDDRPWSVEVMQVEGPARPVSCGKPPEPSTKFVTRIEFQE